ncbi:hypothetical protein [Agrococcus casei]|uniref:hypothetical protein n=1 Tax=Agrococcus casei TaxID=343512 RepID=UPI003F9390FB
MGPDVKIDYITLTDLVTYLGEIVEELRGAGDRSGQIRDAIVKEMDEHEELRQQAIDSETRWNTKRSNLADGLEEFKKHANDVLTGFQDADAEIAADMEAADNAPCVA